VRQLGVASPHLRPGVVRHRKIRGQEGKAPHSELPASRRDLQLHEEFITAAQSVTSVDICSKLAVVTWIKNGTSANAKNERDSAAKIVSPTNVNFESKPS
jgi:hypothetical protein